ncbi:MAG TPA: tyrosine-type recombinase/integrase [Baekduia sp.]|nr:tyrosine-type recombinase/integrase [Baekduia sp.]
MTTDNGRYPRAVNSAAYASTNATSGPDTRTPSTPLDALAITASFSENKKDDDHPTAPRYADNYTAISPLSLNSPAEVGITRTSAYSWLCRRRHNHELRHTFGTQMAAAGAPLRAIQEWMGHADASTTEICAHYAPDPTAGAAFAQRGFGGLADGRRPEAKAVWT